MFAVWLAGTYILERQRSSGLGCLLLNPSWFDFHFIFQESWGIMPKNLEAHLENRFAARIETLCSILAGWIVIRS